jgi:putative tryptophan/tyrosine transport system substrate-binding protein
VFQIGVDPVHDGLVASLNRPSGNLTGIANLAVEIGPKRLELLRELLPSATVVGALVNPTRRNAEIESRELQAAARWLEIKLRLLHASTDSDLDMVFAALDQLQAGGLVISGDPFFNSRSEQLGALTVRHAVPAIYQFRDFVAAGGLISYGTSLTNAHRLAGIYVGRIP